MERNVLLLGDPALYEKSEELHFTKDEHIDDMVQDLHDTLLAFRQRYGAGRAIAAPQIGYQKRLIYLLLEKPILLINPSLYFPNEEKIVVIDDCMSFPNLKVKVERYRHCHITYQNQRGEWQHWDVHDDLSELIQHEYDHLDGILATQRALDDTSLFMI